jgi:uncharacterized membrane protein YraQ (UPF0718 family)
VIAIVLEQMWLVAGQMAPYLLFGFLAAGLMSVLVPPDLVERHLGRPGAWQVVKATLLGVPLPLCSCSVLPVAASLRRHGAAKGATLAFLASTPQTGVDSVLVTWGLLGPVVVAFRVVTAFVSGVLGGLTLNVAGAGGVDDSAADESCPCCHDRGRRGALRRALRYGFVDLAGEIGGALLLGVALSGLMTALVPENYFADKLGPGVVSMLIMMAVGIPLYACSSGSVPVALGLIHMGVTPGAALVFLITAPATNAATVTTVARVLGRRAAGIYLGAIAASALTAGLLLDAAGGSRVAAEAAHAHATAGGWLNHLCAAVLVVLLVSGCVRRLRARGRKAAPETR